MARACWESRVYASSHPLVRVDVLKPVIWPFLWKTEAPVLRKRTSWGSRGGGGNESPIWPRLPWPLAGPPEVGHLRSPPPPHPHSAPFDYRFIDRDDYISLYWSAFQRDWMEVELPEGARKEKRGEVKRWGGRGGGFDEDQDFCFLLPSLI